MLISKTCYVVMSFPAKADADTDIGRLTRGGKLILYILTKYGIVVATVERERERAAILRERDHREACN